MIRLYPKIRIRHGIGDATFNCLSVFPSWDRNIISGETLRGRTYVHVKSIKRKLLVKISGTEFATWSSSTHATLRQFLLEMFQKSSVTINTFSSATSQNSEEQYAIEDTSIPLEFLESSIDLPELTITFIRIQSGV